MTEESATPEPAAPRRLRFPLTTIALAGSAIAIPLYLMATTTLGGSDGDPLASLAPATNEAPTPGSTVAGPGAPSSPSAERAERAEKAERSEWVESEPSELAAGDGDPLAAPSAPEPAPAHVFRGEEGRMGKPGGSLGSLGLVGTGRGGGGIGDGLGASSPKRKSRKRTSTLSLGGASTPLGGLGAPPPPMDEDVGYDANLQAGQLTAGAIDDRTSTRLLDELRAKAVAIDPALGQSVPSHKAKGVAPSASPSAPVLEIGFVLDTTGSMGDELQYLKTEIRSIAQQIGHEYPNVAQRYGLVVYRDQSDAYVVLHHDFEPLDAFVDHLGGYGAGGGGDFPEAMDQGLQAASALQWSDQDAAKLVFLVADAPPHAEGYRSYVHATGSLASKGVSVYPVASSGVEPVCEYLMRWAARATGGTYLFLTDHSGIGNAHADPHADDYELKSLRDHMLDVIRAELGGQGSPGGDTVVNVDVRVDRGSTWMDRHGLFVFILGGMFLLGFAGDMAAASLRRRR
ncbi:MAG: VWA domain-containing protein [Myxococcales bacterium]|nr:VWA domain-containing protein [Myxococcales bacterium]